MTLNLETIPLIDGHCHSFLKRQPQSEEEFRRFFTESFAPRMAAEFVPHTIFYQQGVRELAIILEHNPEAEAEEIFLLRFRYPFPEYLRRIVDKAGLRGLVVDFGLLKDQSYSPQELQGLLQGTSCKVWPVLRLETLIEDLLQESGDFEDLVLRYEEELRQARPKGFVALKSIVAYRTGLNIERGEEREARKAFLRLKEESLKGTGRLRLAEKPLLDYFLSLALERAVEEGLPFQFHTGFGDPDVDLLKANPLLLRPILQEERFRSLPIVLLHVYPYLREAAYLSSVYENVYVDLSLTIPFLGPSCHRAVEEVLALAPATKVLYGSDAWGVPDLLWLGVVNWRRALRQVLEDWIKEGALDPSRARAVAEKIFFRNALSLYYKD